MIDVVIRLLEVVIELDDITLVLLLDRVRGDVLNDRLLTSL